MTFDPEHLAVLRLNCPLLFCVSDADSAFTLPTGLEEVCVCVCVLPGTVCVCVCVQVLVKCGVGRKPLVLVHLLSQSQATLCFTNSRDTAHRYITLGTQVYNSRDTGI